LKKKIKKQKILSFILAVHQ